MGNNDAETGPLDVSKVFVGVKTDSLAKHVPLTIVTPPVGPGSVLFGIDCNQRNDLGGAIQYDQVQLSAVALS